jgi:mandelamide amidase
MNKGTTTSRREFLALSAALAASAGACSRTAEEAEPAVDTKLTQLSATAAVTAMRNGDLLAEDYANALLDRCAEAAHLNAFITLEPDRVREAAVAADQLRASGATPGALHGLPIPVKDSVNTKDYPTTGGTNALRNFFPAENAALVDRLIAAGAIVMGKTNIHELSFGWTSNNQAFGAVRNPYRNDRIPGGSSGGTAAAVAAGMAPLGIAEDTQGSIRVPAAMCGIYGFRPTTHRYPNSGVLPITPLFDQVGPHARNVADIALFDNVISGESIVTSPAVLQGLRLGLPRAFFFDDLQNDVAQVTDDALRRLADTGVEFVEVDVPEIARLIGLTTAQVQQYHVMPMLQKYLQEYAAGITFDELLAQASPEIQEIFKLLVLPGGAMTPTEEDFVAARDIHLPALRRTLQRYFADNGIAAMIFPTTQIAASPIGQERQVDINGSNYNFEIAAGRNISPGSTAGLPGLVLPAGLDRDGLPVSVELDGPAGSDRELIAIALAVEQVLGHLPPPDTTARR